MMALYFVVIYDEMDVMPCIAALKIRKEGKGNFLLEVTPCSPMTQP